MQFGIGLMGMSLRHMGRVARHAEALGFDSVWVPEHLVFPEEMPPQYPYSDSGLPPVTSASPLYDAFVQLAQIAGQTERIKLGTYVYVLPLRHPLVTARSVVTLDRMSGGRALLGVGVGWLEAEFTIMGLDPKDRGKAADEIIPLLRRLWTEPLIEHASDRFPLPPVKFEPKPIAKPHPPILVGGASKPALRRAGTLGDGYIDIGSKSVEELAGKLAAINEHRAAAGRMDDTFEVTTDGGVGSDVAAIKRCEALGVNRVVVNPVPQVGDNDPGLLEAWLTEYAATVIADVAS